MLHQFYRRAFLSAFAFLVTITFAHAEPRWYKGNLHTHSLWSDGDAYPEVIIDWYKKHGYNFLALSDHNVVQQGERWTNIETNKGGTNAFATYLKLFGPDWVEQREQNGNR